MNQAFATTPVRAAILVLTLALGACSSVTGNGDTIDYGQAARKNNPLEVPPDLSALSTNSRYLPQATSSVSANQLQAGARDVKQPQTQVAPQALAGMHIERQGQWRWLVSPQSPEVLFPKIRQFWQNKGFTLTTDSPETGFIETDWAENRAKIPGDLLRNTIGKVFDSLYSTGERDRFRTRLERSANGTEITITHIGLQEVYADRDGARDTSTTWTRRASDPQLEAEMLVRLMIALGATESTAREASAAVPVATPPGATASAPTALSDQGAASLLVAEAPDRTWRRLGLALDRSGFTVEDRDRNQMLYFVRYADPKLAGNEEPGFFDRLFSSKANQPLSRFRLALKAQGSGTLVSVLNEQGQADDSAGARNIIQLLSKELGQ